MVAKGRRVPFFPAPDLSSADHPWAGYSFEEAKGPPGPMPSHSWPKTTLLYVTGGQASLDWKHRGIWRKDRCPTGTVSIMRRDVEIQSAAPSEPMPILAMQIDNSRLQGIAPDYVFTIEKSLKSAQVTGDGRLAAMMLAMSMEVRQGCPSGRLYGESISLALLAYLSGTYAVPRPAAGGVSTLSPAQKQSMVGYICEHLSGDVSVSDLAALLHMSPSHFARVFKASFGISPYNFIMQERVKAAKEMLASAKYSASQVSNAFGFSSQSHFAKVFHRFTGVTPKQYRAGF